MNPSGLDRAAGASGMLFRRRYLGELFASRSAVDVLEICSDHYLDAARETLAELDLLREHFPVLPHGINLSIGTASGLDDTYLRFLRELIERTEPAWFSDHLAFTRSGGREAGHLIALPRTRAALEAVERNVEHVRKAIPGRRFALENVAASFDWPDDEMEPGAFTAAVLERTGCDLVLDVANLHGDAFNLGHDPYAFIDAIAPEKIVQIHVAGGHVASGALIDSHSQPAPEPVWAMLEYVARRARLANVAPPVVILEREEALPPFDALVAEMARGRRILAAAGGGLQPVA